MPESVVRLPIIDASRAQGIEHCALPSGKTADQFSQLLHLICQNHQQPLTDGRLKFLIQDSQRWLEGNDVLSEQPDIGSTLIAVSEAAIERFGTSPETYTAIVELRDTRDKIQQRELLRRLVDSIVTLSESLNTALEMPRHVLTLNPNWFGIGVDLRALRERIRSAWAKRRPDQEI